MEVTVQQAECIAKMTFAAVYPHYLAKVEKKGLSRDELHEVINWLTGFSDVDLEKFMARNATVSEFVALAKLNPKAHQITGVLCGYRIEDITFPLTRSVRYLDKLVDELAKGKQMEKILRSG